MFHLVNFPISYVIALTLAILICLIFGIKTQ
jgi:hypothetical protein